MATAIATRPARPLGWRKYWTMFSAGVQAALTYRAAATVWMIVDFAPSVVMVLVWCAAYGGGVGEIEGYSLPDMVTYYLLAGVLAAALAMHAEFTIGGEIREGRLTPQLTRPYIYPLAVLFRESGWVFTRALVGIPVYGLLFYLFRDLVVLPHLPPWSWVGAGLSLVLSYFILCEISVGLACVSLWLVESSGIGELWWSIGNLLSGALLPLELLPGPIRAVAFALPYRWATYFPVRILLGKVPPDELWTGVLIQLAWAIGLGAFVAFMWRRGLKAFEGWGG